MILRPLQRLQVSAQANAIGTMQQAAHVNTDTFYTLLSATGLEKEGLFFERNTGNLMLSPSPVWEDLNLSDWTASAPFGATGGKWREVVDRALSVRTLSQYDATPDREWLLESNAPILAANACFSLKLSLGPCPKAATHDREGYYRQVYFPADSVAGETTYKVDFRYGEAPALYVSNDAGALYSKVGDIPSPVDFGLLRSGKNVEFTLTFLQMDGAAIVWIGDIDRYTLIHRQDGINTGATPAGKLGFAGRNGAFQVAFAPLRFMRIGRYHSFTQFGPADMTARPQFVIQPPVPPGAGVSVTGGVETVDRVSRLYTYTLELQAEPLDSPNEDYSITTPLVKSCTVVWPPKWNPPPTGGWQDVAGINEIVERRWFDINTGLLHSSLSVELDNNRGQRRVLGGVQAAQLFLGYAHAGTYLRGRFLANMRAAIQSKGGTSTVTFEGEDLLYVLARQPLKDDIYPSRWCVYALARLLLQHGQIVPDLLRTIPDCPFGPDPACPHPKMVAHPGFKAPRYVLPCLEEVRQVIGGWMGQDQTGQFRFEPFVWTPRKTPVKSFYEGATDAFGRGGGALNEFLGGLVRTRNLDEVVNDISLVGFDQGTGEVFLRHFEDIRTIRSKYDPTSPNYLGFVRPLLHVSSMFSTPEFTDFVGGNLLQFVSLPGEFISIPCWGQPTLFPGDIIEVNDRRTVGFGVRYWITEVTSRWRSGVSTSMLGGQWIGIGNPPGVGQ